MNGRVVLCVVGLAGVGLAPPAGYAGVVACQKGTKVLLRVDTCRKKETRVGLDADRLGGQTPAEVTAAVLSVVPPPVVPPPPVATVAAALYTRMESVVVFGDDCDFLYVDCDDGNDMRVGCTGGFEFLDGRISAVLQEDFSGDPPECVIAGCGTGTYDFLRGTITCLRVP